MKPKKVLNSLKECFKNPLNSERGFSTFNFLFISFFSVLTVFSVLLSFNNEVLSEYENENGIEKYNWFNPLDVSRFYSCQIKISEGNIHSAPLTLVPERDIKYCYIIDKTIDLPKQNNMLQNESKKLMDKVYHDYISDEHKNDTSLSNLLNSTNWESKS